MTNQQDSHGNHEIDRRRFLGGLACGLAATSGVVGCTRRDSGEGASERSAFPTRSKYTFRFAAAFPPRAEQLFPSERWLEAISRAGYTHLFLQVDPFYHPEGTLQSSEGFGSSFLSVFAMAAGPVCRSYQAWLRVVSEAASRHGLKLGMELWEPQLPKYAAQVIPAEWKGPRLRGDGIEPLCVSHPAARAWLLEGFQAVPNAAPAMNTFALGARDNDAELCNDQCPRCRSAPIQERFGRLYRDIDSACRHVRSDFQLVPYDWEWPDEYFDATLSKLPKHTPILTRLERFALATPDPSHPQWQGHVYDESLGCDQLGPGFRRAQSAATSHAGSVLAMLTLSGMFEGWELPYIPAAGQIAKKFDRMRSEKCDGWVDYDCGGIHQGLVLDLVSVVQRHPGSSVEEWLELLATGRYGTAEAAATARDTWRSFDEGVRAFPAVLDFESIDTFSGRFAVAMGLVPMHPFLPERARQAKDAGAKDFWFDPHNFLTPEALPPIRHCMRRALQFARAGFATSQRLVSQASSSQRPHAEFDTAMAELTCLAWQSIANFYEWAAFVQGEKSVPIARVLESEIEVTRRYRDLQSHPDLQIGNMTWAWQPELAWSLRQTAADASKCDALKGCAPSSQLAARGDFYGWKLQGLQEQLNNLPKASRL